MYSISDSVNDGNFFNDCYKYVLFTANFLLFYQDFYSVSLNFADQVISGRAIGSISNL